MSDMISQVAKHLCRTHQEMDFAKARNYAKTAIEAMVVPTIAMIEAADAAVGEWRKTLSRDEAMIRSYMPPARTSRKFIASATPEEKHVMRYRAMIAVAMRED